MANFVDELTKQLATWPDDTEWLTPDIVRDMLVQAAAATLGERDRFSITLHREVEPVDLDVHTVLDLGEGDRFTLFAEDVVLLRALLLTWDESRPARVGDPLTMGCKLEDGRLVSEVVPEMLE